MVPRREHAVDGDQFAVSDDVVSLLVLVRGPEHDHDVDGEEHVDDVVDHGDGVDAIHGARHRKLQRDHEGVVDREEDDDQVPAQLEALVRSEAEVENSLPPGQLLVVLDLEYRLSILLPP